MSKSKHEEAVEMLNQLEDIMIKVEMYEQFNKNDWLALARCLYFLLREYVIKDGKVKKDEQVENK